MARRLFVYILSSFSGVLYIGVTNNLRLRVIEHKMGKASKFTTRYKVKRLVYWELVDGPLAAIAREKQLKGWTRSRKLALIATRNPDFRDLAESWCRRSGAGKPPGAASVS